MVESGCGRQVLIVEDDEDVRDSILEVLEDNEYAVVGAANGREGLERLRERPDKPCVILLDIMMPVMDGREFRAAQLGDPSLDGIPVVVLTAHADAEQTARDLGASSFLRKPVKLEVLLAEVRRHCRSDP